MNAAQEVGPVSTSKQHKQIARTQSSLASSTPVLRLQLKSMTTGTGPSRLSMRPNDKWKKAELGSQICLCKMWVWGENGQLLYYSLPQRWPGKAMNQKILPKDRASEDAAGIALCREWEAAQGKNTGLRPMGNGSSSVFRGPKERAWKFTNKKSWGRSMKTNLQK